jgi:predicted transcriptional regulator
MTAFSLRLPEDLESRLNQEAQAEGLPRSEIARTAIEEFLDKRERERFMAAFVTEARAAYATPELRREALELAAEALPGDNAVLALAETPAPKASRPAPSRKSRK